MTNEARVIAELQRKLEVANRALGRISVSTDGNAFDMRKTARTALADMVGDPFDPLRGPLPESTPAEVAPAPNLDSIAKGIDGVVAERNRLKLQLDKAQLGLKLIKTTAGMARETKERLGIYAETVLEEIEKVP